MHTASWCGQLAVLATHRHRRSRLISVAAVIRSTCVECNRCAHGAGAQVRQAGIKVLFSARTLHRALQEDALGASPGLPALPGAPGPPLSPPPAPMPRPHCTQGSHPSACEPGSARVCPGLSYFVW